MKLVSALALTLLPLAAQAKPAAHTDHTNSALTGSYQKDKNNTLDVQALPGGKVQFSLSATVHPDAPYGPNLGDADATVTLHKGVGVYIAPEKGRLILRFLPHRVMVTQQGTSLEMGFGYGVNATGEYKKVSRKPPKFDAAR